MHVIIIYTINLQILQSNAKRYQSDSKDSQYLKGLRSFLRRCEAEVKNYLEEMVDTFQNEFTAYTFDYDDNLLDEIESDDSCSESDN